MSEVLERMRIAGRPLVCTICEGDTFAHRQMTWTRLEGPEAQS